MGFETSITALSVCACVRVCCVLRYKLSFEWRVIRSLSAGRDCLLFDAHGLLQCPSVTRRGRRLETLVGHEREVSRYIWTCLVCGDASSEKNVLLASIVMRLLDASICNVRIAYIRRRVDRFRVRCTF